MVKTNHLLMSFQDTNTWAYRCLEDISELTNITSNIVETRTEDVEVTTYSSQSACEADMGRYGRSKHTAYWPYCY